MKAQVFSTITITWSPSYQCKLPVQISGWHQLVLSWGIGALLEAQQIPVSASSPEFGHNFPDFAEEKEFRYALWHLTTELVVILRSVLSSASDVWDEKFWGWGLALLDCRKKGKKFSLATLKFLIWSAVWPVIRSVLYHICNITTRVPWWITCLNVFINSNVTFVIIRTDKNNGATWVWNIVFQSDRTSNEMSFYYQWNYTVFS